MLDKKFKITCIQHLVKRKEPAKSGDILFGAEFINIRHSIAGGFCVEVDDKGNEIKPKKEAKKEAKKASKKEASEKSTEADSK